jgi:translocation protein SEC62
MSEQHGDSCQCGHDHAEEKPTVRHISVSEPSKAPADVHIAANYLKDPKKCGMKQRYGVFNGKRFEYFKGNCFCSLLVIEATLSHLWLH